MSTNHSFPNGLHPHPSGSGTRMACLHCGVVRDVYHDGRRWRLLYDGKVWRPQCHKKRCECRAALESKP